MGRLHLQEQRINTLVRRGDVVRDALAAAHKRAADLRERFGSLQRAEVQRLQTEESEAAAQVSSEQARWAEINQRLEELDRALARR